MKKYNLKNRNFVGHGQLDAKKFNHPSIREIIWSKKSSSTSVEMKEKVHAGDEGLIRSLSFKKRHGQLNEFFYYQTLVHSHAQQHLLTTSWESTPA